MTTVILFIMVVLHLIHILINQYQIKINTANHERLQTIERQLGLGERQ